MKMIMLAAGKGTRISRQVDGKPKCCLNIGGIELINRNIQKLKTLGFDEIIVATGYKKDHVTSKVPDSDVVFVNNPFYEVTNSIASLWFCQGNIKTTSDLYIMNGDVFFDENILRELINTNESVTMIGDSSRIDEADYKFKWDDNYKLRRFGKELPKTDISGEYVGIAKIKEGFVPSFVNKLNKMILQGEYNCWWEDVLYRLSSEKEVDINVLDLKGEHFWAEIDFIEDYNRIVEYLKSEGK